MSPSIHENPSGLSPELSPENTTVNTSEQSSDIQKKLYSTTLSHPVFDRQIRIPGWNQKIVEEQILLCLGCGGLGCSVALGAARMGVKKIILVDYDVVESHNLNRQLLFHNKHVGRSKVECAKEVLQELHLVGETEIIAVHLDAKDRWDEIVKLSNDCTVIFNLIDQGFEWDVAVQSLALYHQVPYVSGGTFQTTTTIDFCLPTGSPCFLCMGYVVNENIQKLLPENICNLQNLNFIKKEQMPIGASNIYVASTCSNLMLATWTQWLNHPKEKFSNRCFLYMNNFDVMKWQVDPEKNCVMCSNIVQRLKTDADCET